MTRIFTLIRRWWRARDYGVRFRGMSHTTLPATIRFGGATWQVTLPDEPLLVADFVNVVLDDDYGLRGIDPPPRTVVDVGGNVGLFALFAHERFPAATIHVYEPSPATAAFAQDNLAGTTAQVFVEGVAAEGGTAAMVELGSTNLARTERTADGGIALTAFATVLERIGGRIDLLKVDCEGAEWDFMRDRDLFAQVGRIRMEYHLVDGRTLADLDALAAGIGFRIDRRWVNQGFGIAWLERA
jgi:FkbM family methyltransferase